ncbi:MAG TPA: hypothetical protein VMM12_13900 [Longimicrobiales bacterium]|nr:hypothetical protein [Longimicrobiales bacterium]
MRSLLEAGSDRLRPPRAALLLASLAMAGCGDAVSPSPLAPDGPNLAAQDSAGSPADMPLAPLSTNSIVLEEGGGFAVELVSTSCGWGQNRLQVLSPVSEILLTNACFDGGPGQWSFEGPFPPGTVVDIGLFVGVRGTFGARAIQGSYPVWVVAFEDAWDADFNDVVVQVRALRARETLVVELTPEEAEVRPVLDRTFNAITQHWDDPAQPHRLHDLVDLRVKVEWEAADGSRRPADGAGIDLTVEPVDTSGGHVHGNRPKGTFFTSDDRPTAGTDADQRKGVLRPELSLTADGSGTAEAVYRTSGVSGREWVRVEATAEGETASAEAVVRIRYPGLTAMDRTGSTFYYSDQAHTIHGNINHYADPAFAAAVLDAFEVYFGGTTTPRFLGGEIRFVITEASLAWGGLFDFETEWSNPHRLHRTGRDVDVRYWSLSDSHRQVFIEACSEAGIRCERHPNFAGADPNNPRVHHFHIMPGAGS